MRRLTIAGAVALGVAAGPSAAVAGSGAIKSISRTSGTPKTTFVVQFSKPVRDSKDVTYSVFYEPGKGAKCAVKQDEQGLASDGGTVWQQSDFTRFGASRKATLKPDTVVGEQWCAGAGTFLLVAERDLEDTTIGTAKVTIGRS